ncbi:MAG: hypothetical protein LBL98_04115 [Ruminococcus sp.]|jgi:hypothetical protein|nr:hypothetical protein [Ruminococcus sp.]
MKKLLSAILAAGLAFGLMAVPASALDDGVKLNREELETSGDSVVHITYFDASRSTSEAARREIMMINSDIAYTIEPQVRIAERTLSDETYEGTFEIRSYSNTSDKFLQVVATSIEYPTYGYDPYAYSWVYDRTAKKYLRLSDVLIKDGLTEDEILKDAEELYTTSHGEYLFSGKVQGFWICEEEEVPHSVYILRMNKCWPASETWQTLMVYVPGQYTEDGTPLLYEDVTLGDRIEYEEAEGGKNEYDNLPKYNVKYEDADGNYMRFLRDQSAFMKIDGKLSSWSFYHNAGMLQIVNRKEAYEATVENGTILKVNIGGKDYTFTAAP